MKNYRVNNTLRKYLSLTMALGLFLSLGCSSSDGEDSAPDSAQQQQTEPEKNSRRYELCAGKKVEQKLFETEIPQTEEEKERGVPSYHPIVHPPLPSGLYFDLENVQIAGAVLGPSPSEEYEISIYHNDGTLLKRSQVNLTVRGDITKVRYPSSSYSFLVGQDIDTKPLSDNLFLSEEEEAGEIAFSIEPSLPAGLSLSASDGRIYGNMSEPSAKREYVVSVHSNCGVQSIPLSLHGVRGNLPPRITHPDSVRLLPAMEIWTDDTQSGRNDINKFAQREPALPHPYFVTKLSASDPEGDAVRFRIERQSDPDTSYYPVCKKGNGVRTCYPLLFGINEKGYVYAKSARGSRHRLYMYDMPPQTIRISAEDLSTGRKSYKDIQILPAQGPDCSGYPNKNRDRFECLYVNHEMLPPAPLVSQNKMRNLRNALPSLYYPKSNYSLVFQEEFNSALDKSKWNFNGKERTDRRGRKCAEVKNGSYFMTKISGCGAGLNSQGKMEFRYGYLEFKYRVGLRRTWTYINHAFVIGGIIGRRDYNLPDYQTSIRSTRDYLSYQGVEHDLFEYTSTDQIAHVHANVYKNYSGPLFADSHRFSTHLSLPMCSPRRDHRNFQFQINGCSSDSSNGRRSWGYRQTFRRRDYATITQGIEWTPKGYKYFFKVDGAHSSLKLRRKDTIGVVRNRVLANAQGKKYYGPDENLKGRYKDRYFHYERDRNGRIIQDSQLVQIGINHLPTPLGFAAWGWPKPNFNTIENGTGLYVDYIRLYKPSGNYADVERVYK